MRFIPLLLNIFLMTQLSHAVVTHKLPATPKAPQTSPALQALQKIYGTNKAFSAQFEQKLFNKIMRREDVSTGLLQFIKPNKIRWEYQTPNKKLFIVNGSNLWVYQEADKQVMIDRCFKEDLLTASLAFLVNPQALQRDFTVLELPGNEAEKHLRLTPKKAHAVINEMVLIIDKKTSHIIKSIIKDKQNNINQFTFSEQNLKAHLDLKLFSFMTPKGVSVSEIGNCKQNTVTSLGS